MLFSLDIYDNLHIALVYFISPESIYLPRIVHN